MDADLDLLLTAVYVTADDLLPERPGNAKRIVTDAEVVTLCVAQAIMGIPSDRRFLAVARKHLRHLFPQIPGQAGYFKRRRRLVDTLEWLMSVFASQSPGFYDDLLLVDSTPVECARSRPLSAQHSVMLLTMATAAAIPRTSPRTDPPTHQEHLLELQGHPHPRAPRRTNPPRPPRAHPSTPPHPRRRHHPQPPTRPPKPRTRQLQRLNPVESII
jgi:hypothetical protein